SEGGLCTEFQAALPSWLSEIATVDERIEDVVWWLGWFRLDEGNVELPADLQLIGRVQSLFDFGAENLRATVRAHEAPTDGDCPPALDPAALRSLHRLRHLTLERVDDEVMGCLDSLPELRSLELTDKCGPMSEQAAAHLKSLHNIRSLSAMRQCLGDAGMAAIGSLTSLESLTLSGTTDADIAQLACLTRLRYLKLDGTAATDAGLAPLTTLTQLEEVELNGFRITGTGLSAFAGKPRLHRLSLFGCGLTDDGLSGLRELASLRELCLYYTPIAGPGLAHLARLRRLRCLDLSLTEIDDRGLDHLPDLARLEVLELVSTRITEASLRTINRLSTLRELLLVCTRVATLRDIDLSRLPNLMLVDVDSSWSGRDEMFRLREARPDMEFSRARCCQRLDLHRQFDWLLEEARERPESDNPIHVSVEGPDFGDREVAALCGLPRLDTLRLESTRVTDRGLTGIVEFDQLERVDLANTLVGDAVLLALSTLPRLKELDLSYSQVTPQGLRRLATFPALEAVGLDPSQFTPDVVADLKRIPALHRLFIYRDRSPWGKQYRGARDFDEFLDQLREDLPTIEVTLKEYCFPFHCVEF
ncbi:MAG: hypothetical protein ACREHD_30705, partial [Pirellulales bacterium]